jgi:hypothetical protein
MEEWTSNLMTSSLIVVITIVVLIIVQIVARRLYKYIDSIDGVGGEWRL